MLFQKLTIASVILLASKADAVSPSCGDFTSLSLGDTCTDTWNKLRDQLRPTQRSVGYAWVFRKVLKDMTSESKAQEYISSKVIPISLGPTGSGTAYILDAHHTLASLDLSGYEEVNLTLSVGCDALATVPASQQLEALAARKDAYLYGRVPGCPNSLPEAIPAASVPTNLAFRKSAVTMDDDRWRSLSSFARKIKNGPISCTDNPNMDLTKYCGRAYNKTCATNEEGIPFIEFRWSYFYNDVYNTPSLWSNTSAFNAFSEAYNTLVSPTPNSPVDNVDDWEAAAHYLVYPSRESFASEYRVPLGALAGPLPGYIAGLVPIPDKDVDCAVSQCSLNPAFESRMMSGTQDDCGNGCCLGQICDPSSTITCGRAKAQCGYTTCTLQTPSREYRCQS